MAHRVGETISLECADSINSIAVACYSMSKKHVHEFIALPDTWNSFISQCSQLISIYELAHTYDPDNAVILKNIISLCEENIEGIAYTDPYDNNASKAVFLSPEYEKTMRELISKYGEILKKIDPTYKLPNPVAAKPESSCFVVTATMGNESSYPVIILRKFRDNCLLRTYSEFFLRSNRIRKAKLTN